MHDAAGIWVKNERLLRWSLRPFNHNLLRISRILRSLRLLGRGQESIALLEALDSVFGEVPGLQRTFTFWHKAVYGPNEFPAAVPKASATDLHSKPLAASPAAAGPRNVKSLASWGIKPFLAIKRKPEDDGLQVIHAPRGRAGMGTDSLTHNPAAHATSNVVPSSVAESPGNSSGDLGDNYVGPDGPPDGPPDGSLASGLASSTAVPDKFCTSPHPADLTSSQNAQGLLGTPASGPTSSKIPASAPGSSSHAAGTAEVLSADQPAAASDGLQAAAMPDLANGGLSAPSRGAAHPAAAAVEVPDLASQGLSAPFGGAAQPAAAADASHADVDALGHLAPDHSNGTISNRASPFDSEEDSRAPQYSVTQMPGLPAPLTSHLSAGVSADAVESGPAAESCKVLSVAGPAHTDGLSASSESISHAPASNHFVCMYSEVEHSPSTADSVIPKSHVGPQQPGMQIDIKPLSLPGSIPLAAEMSAAGASYQAHALSAACGHSCIESTEPQKA